MLNVSRIRPVARHLAVALLSVLGFTACATSTPRGSAERAVTRPPAEQIRWPAEFNSKKSAFFVHNEVEIKAPPKIVWEIITDVQAWPDWYSGAENVSIKNPVNGRVGPESVVTWRTMGLNFDSVVREFEPHERFAWESRKAVIQGYHAWLIIPTKDGCRVITEESFQGGLAYLQGTFIPNKLHGLHQEFLDTLKVKAEAKHQGKAARR